MAGITNNLASCLPFHHTNEEVVALLASLHAGDGNLAVHCTGDGSLFVHFAGDGGGLFVHYVDVYSDAPAILVSNLQPAQGDSVWYLLCPKKYKSNVKPGGRRLRAVVGGGCWHGEAGPKKNKVEVVLGDGRRIVGSCRTFSYGYKTAEKLFKRPGWCMVEYELEEEGYDHVLCRVYRSPRAAKASSGNSNSAAVLPSASLSGHQVQETRLSHDAQMMPVQVQYGGGQSFYPQEGLQPGTGGPVYDGDTFPFVIGGYEENLPTYHDALTLDGYLLHEGPELGDGLVVHGGGMDDYEELLAQLLDQADYDPHLAGATLATPPDGHFFDGLPF